MALEREIQTYKLKLPELLAHEGKFVVICGEEVVGFHASMEDALQAGQARCGLEPFLARRVRADEPVYFVPRGKPCP